MATGDAAAIGLALSAMASAVAGAPLLAGVAAGLALACKVTSLGLALASLCLLAIAPDRLRSGSQWLLGAILSFLVACPFAWTDPVRMLKATVGNFLRPGSGAGLRQVSTLLVDVMGWSWLPIAVLAALGLIPLLREPSRRGLGLSLVVSLVRLVAPIARAGAVFPRYALGLAAFLCLLAAIGIDPLWSDRATVKESLPMAMVAAASLVALSATTAARIEWTARRPAPVDAAIARLVAEGRGGELFLPASAELRAWELMSKAQATQLGMRAQTVEADAAGVAAFMQRRGLSTSAARVLRSAFTEDEAAIRGRLDAVGSVAPEGPWRPHLYDPTDGDAVARIAIVEGPRAFAIQAFSSAASPAALVIDRRDDTLGPEGEALGAGWWLYRP